jgi:hypothetical protein
METGGGFFDRMNKMDRMGKTYSDTLSVFAFAGAVLHLKNSC